MHVPSSRLSAALTAMPILLAAFGSHIATAQAQSAPAPSHVASQATAEDKDRIIADLLRRVEALEQRLASSNPPQAQPAAPAASVAPAQTTAAASSVPGPAASANEPADEETSRALERTLIREGGLVLPPKMVEVEPRFSYSYRGSNSLDIISVDGQAQVARQDVKRRMADASLGIRVGLPWAMQIDASLPYSVNRERRVITGGTDHTDRASGFGGFEVGLTKQLLDENKGTPALLGSLRWRDAGSDGDRSNPVAAGSSFRSLQAALTVVKRQDPMVFYGSVSHAINHARTISGSRFEPGNTTGLKVGSILAVSPDTSFRLGFEVSRVGETSVNGARRPGSNSVVGLLNTGFSFVLTPKTFLGVELGVGLTDSSPDFRVDVSLPVRF